MASIFTSLERTLAAGLAVLVAIIIVFGALGGGFPSGNWAWWTLLMKWLHVASGVMWIGLLWYLNFVQVPTVPKIEPVEHRAAITKFIAPNVLFWFRYGALSTVVTGLLVAWMSGYLLQALTFQKPYTVIGVGMWMALIMAYNVWFIIWPNQQRALGLVDADADTKAKSARMAMLTSRFNTMFSIGMLYCMVFAKSGSF